MKTVKYIIFLLCAGIAITSCRKDPAVTSIDPALGYYVSFDKPTLSVAEGDTVTVNILLNTDFISRQGAFVDFTVIPPVTTLPASASYSVLAMNNNPLLNLNVNGSNADDNGYASFKFVAADNNDVDGSRTFKIAISSTSLDVPVGNPFGSKMDTISIAVKDDEIPILMSELVGTWTVTDEWTYSSGWVKRNDYTITIAEVNPTTISIAGLIGVARTVTATVNLSAKTKTITIPLQEVTPTLNTSYTTYMHSTGRFFIGTAVSPANSTAVIEKNDDGQIFIHWESVYDTQSDGGYGYFAWNVGGYAAYFGGFIVDEALWNKD
jgi:hypothetical protein